MFFSRQKRKRQLAYLTNVYSNIPHISTSVQIYNPFHFFCCRQTHRNRCVESAAHLRQVPAAQHQSLKETRHPCVGWDKTTRVFHEDKEHVHKDISLPG